MRLIAFRGKFAKEAQFQLPEDMDLDQPQLLEDADPFAVERAGGRRSSPQPEETETDSEQARALQARRRAPRGRRAIPVDEETQVPNAVLKDWSDNYLANMDQARQQRAANRAGARAKRNAYFFVYGRGLGSGDARNPAFALPNHPLAAFCGAPLEQLLAASAGRRPPKRSSSPASDEADRRTRPRTDDGPQRARGADPFAGDDDALFAPLDDPSLEVARAPASSLADDRSSAMPWNLASSRRGGSRYGRGASALGAAAQQPLTVPRRGSAAPAAGGPFDRRASRVGLSPTPLRARRGASRAPSSIELPSPGALLPSSPAGGGYDEGGDLLGPLQASTSPAKASGGAIATPWARAALGREAANFLAFVRAAAAAPAEGEGEEEDMVGVRFSALLPPAEHSRVVAAQAFQHVLLLATRGAVRARRAEGAWGDVWIGVEAEEVEAAAAATAA